jgi:hypothetical protein
MQRIVKRDAEGLASLALGSTAVRAASSQIDEINQIVIHPIYPAKEVTPQL